MLLEIHKQRDQPTVFTAKAIHQRPDPQHHRPVNGLPAAINHKAVLRRVHKRPAGGALAVCPLVEKLAGRQASITVVRGEQAGEGEAAREVHGSEACVPADVGVSGRRRGFVGQGAGAVEGGAIWGWRGRVGGRGCESEEWEGEAEELESGAEDVGCHGV